MKAMLYNTPFPYFIILDNSVKTSEVNVILQNINLITKTILVMCQTRYKVHDEWKRFISKRFNISDDYPAQTDRYFIDSKKLGVYATLSYLREP